MQRVFPETGSPFVGSMHRLKIGLGFALIMSIVLSLTPGSLRLPLFTDGAYVIPETGMTFGRGNGIAGTSGVHSMPNRDAVAAQNRKSFDTGGGGGGDDTAKLQAMINSVPDSGGEVIIPSGTYLIDAEKSIWLKSNVTLTMAPDAILKAIPNKAASSAVLQISEVQNVRISGGIIIGERKEHSGSEGEWGMGVRITGSRDVLIQSTVANDCWGDGFYIGTGTAGSPSERISLVDVQADNNRRQGITLINGRTISIIRPRLTNSNGTPPSAGMAIEPNKVTETLEDIEVVDAYTAGNAEGIVVSLQKLHGAKTPISIRIRNHQDEGSGRGLLISSNDAIVPGMLTIEDSAWSNAKKNGLAIQNHDHRSFNIEILRPRIANANRSGSNNANTGSAVAIYHFTGRIGIIGNVSIVNPRITDTGEISNTLAAFYISNSMGQEIANLIIVDPLLEGNLAGSAIPYRIQQYIRYTYQ